MLMFGLVAGPAMSCGYAGGILQDPSCSCEHVDGVSCCVSEDEGAARELPPTVAVNGIDLKSLLTPVRYFLGIQPETAGFTPVHARDCTKRPSAPPLLDLNCIRLI
ncbi:MAG: hypothetical protein EOP84_11145 [Verrucomicrobiaceae bacterium]|nr:MAG: hypothetical protein EOP84_11145 [Verrucomicrobiaceae bacterium]